jgi:glucose-6-phosphate 1-epimerase
VVWNPGPEHDKTIADIAFGEYREMLCVQTCNARLDELTLAVGQQHCLCSCITVI